MFGALSFNPKIVFPQDEVSVVWRFAFQFSYDQKVFALSQSHIFYGNGQLKSNSWYKWMVSDGDSKAFNAVEDTCGDNCKVVQLDCVGPIQKRMEKHLLNLKARTKGKLADGKLIRGCGRLSEWKIKQIKRFYGLALRQNTQTAANPSDREVNMAVYCMKKNIIAILNHSVKAQDLSKQHRFCLPGENSWCKWQQDQATGTSTYKDDDCLPEVFLEVLCPTFMTQRETKLLERCVCGAMQNQNECINSLF